MSIDTSPINTVETEIKITRFHFNKKYKPQ